MCTVCDNASVCCVREKEREKKKSIYFEFCLVVVVALCQCKQRQKSSITELLLLSVLLSRAFVSSLFLLFSVWLGREQLVWSG